MKALLFVIGFILAVCTEEASKMEAVSGTQLAVQVLIAFALMALSALCKGKEDA